MRKCNLSALNALFAAIAAEMTLYLPTAVKAGGAAYTEWTEGELRFRAVYAAHSDSCAVGVILEAEGKTYYVTGDTLYNTDIFEDLPEKIDVVFLPVNGVGNNMNFSDGARFCERIGAVAVPLHCGLFDAIDASGFPYENKVVPKFYEEIEL